MMPATFRYSGITRIGVVDTDAVRGMHGRKTLLRPLTGSNFRNLLLEI